LVVDDNRDAADSLALLATLWGYDARRAYDGAAAFQSALTHPPDVIFLDIGMPQMDGFRLAGLLHRQAPLADAVLVAVTGYADEAHRRQWAAAFDHFLVKPIEPAAVERLLIRECIHRAAGVQGRG
jgi:two-component system CheB/CheR fusion protein